MTLLVDCSGQTGRCLGGAMLTFAFCLKLCAADAQSEMLSSWPKDRTPYSRSLVPEDHSAAFKGRAIATFIADVVINNTDATLNSNDTFGDQEPSIAINPANPNEIVITAFSGSWGNNAPWWHSTDGGQTWTKRFTIPIPTGVRASGPEDQSLDYGHNNQLSAVFLATATNRTDIYVGTTTNAASALAFTWTLSGGVAVPANQAGLGNADQPWLLVNVNPTNSAQDNVYAAYDDFSGSPDIRVSVSYGQLPLSFTIDRRVGFSTGFINPGHRMAKDPRNGAMYSLWQRRIAAGAGGSQNINFMLNRSTDGGQTWTLNGSTTGTIVGNGDSTQPTPKFGTVNALLGGVLHAAVDPNSGSVYYVYGKRDAATGNNRLALRRLDDDGAGGLTLGGEVFVTGQVQAALPSVAVNSMGIVGVLYDTFDGFSTNGSFPIFTAHFASSTDGGATFTDTPLYAFLSASTDNGNSRQRVLGDYQVMKSVGTDFYGVFCGNGAGLGRPFANHDPIFFKATVVATPAIVQQPTNQTICQPDTAILSVSATGSQPLSYQWRFNGATLDGQTNSALTLSNTTPALAGGYSVVITNSFGSVTSAIATLTVIPTVPLPFALNAPQLPWTTDGGVIWRGLTNVSHDGVAAAQSGFISDGQFSRLSTTLQGPGTLAFYWKVSSQPNADFLSFGFGGTNLAQISGEVDWQSRSFSLPAGSQNLQWTYAKDSNGSAGLDTAWVDQVSYTLGGTPPFISTSPTNQISLGGAPATFNVTAGGTPALAYQWRFNGNDIPGATSSSFIIPSPLVTDDGSYSVRVTNLYGSVTSSTAILAVVPFTVRGDDSFGQIDIPLGASNAIAVAAGAWHTLILRADGHVLAIGNNAEGEGNVPDALSNVANIAAGGYHSLALRSDQTVVVWGADFYGQVSAIPVISNVIAIAAGTWHSLALRADGTVVGWGDNTWSQSTVPVGLSNVVAIAAGGTHSVALRANGTVVAWGANEDANGGFVGQSVVPPGLSNVVAIAAGNYHSLAVQAEGTVVAWGDNSQSQAQPPGGLSHVVAVAAGGGHSLALKSDSTVTAWGNNLQGQCNIPAVLSNVVLLAAGDSQTLVLVTALPPAPMLLDPARVGPRFSVLLQTFAGRHYALETKTNLTQPAWTALRTNYGTGVMQFLVDPVATRPWNFYRVRQY